MTTPSAPDAQTPTDDAAAIAAVAAKRRGRKSAPQRAGIAEPGAAPMAVQGVVPNHVVASRTLVSAHLGASGPPNMTGGIFAPERPLILEARPTGVLALPQDDADGYVVADCDASESYVPAGCYTPISRILWFKGYRIRADLYKAVMDEHAARTATGDALAAPPAELPLGRDQLPPEVIAANAEPEPGAPTTT